MAAVKIQHKNCLQTTLRKKKISTLFAGQGRPVLGKTVPFVLSTASDLGPYSRPLAQLFPIRTSRPANNIDLLYGKPSPRQIPVLWFSFSVRILQYGPFPWKWSNPCIFVLEQSWQIQHLQPRQGKKVWKLSFFSLKLPAEAKKIEIFPKFQRWMKKTSKPPEVHFTIRNRVPYNKLLTNRACSDRTGEYWPSVVFVRTSLRSVRTVTTSGQYSPVRPTRSVSRRLVFASVLPEVFPRQHLKIK